MSKTILGRGLGDLMNGATPANPPANPALPAPDPAPRGVGPGLGTLLRGPRAPAEKRGCSAQPRNRAASLTWTLLAADAALVVLAGWIVVGRTQPLGLWEGLLCALAVGLGAWLGCCAVWWRGTGRN